MKLYHSSVLAYNTGMVTDILEKTKKLVWPEIERYLKDPLYPSQFQIPQKFFKDVSVYWKINKDYPERKGKYLRPTLVVLTAEAMGLPAKKAIKTAAAMQISEEWILIHDDMEDHSDTRRGSPALHKLYGEELAINAGDALHMVMWKIIGDIGNSKISHEFYIMLMRTALGQGVEQMWTNEKRKINDSEYFFVADSKSAYYSIAGPIRLGAILAGANKAQLNKLTEFGLYLGRCFQLIDDILDYEQDIKEGKITLANTKGVPYTKKLAEEMKKKAKVIFDRDLGFLNHEPAKTQINELIQFILEREY
jgi:geranylgeranyl pyrophosphate synthase